MYAARPHIQRTASRWRRKFDSVFSPRRRCRDYIEERGVVLGTSSTREAASTEPHTEEEVPLGTLRRSCNYLDGLDVTKSAISPST